MATRADSGKLYRLFTGLGYGRSVGVKRLASNEGSKMVGISIAMLIALVAYGDSFFGWSDPKGEIQIAIVTTFILGIICGYRAKG
ncbi:MAG: hypothetical protein ABIO43_11615 [Sphingomicrobium sp.]